MMRRLLSGLCWAVPALLVLAIPVLAYTYSAHIQVANSSNTTAYPMLPIIRSVNNSWMAANGFMLPTALDTRVQTAGGVAIPHTVTNDKLLFATAVPASGNVNLYYTTGNTPLTSLPIVTGYGGYVTTTDNNTMELGTSGNITFSAYIDTSAGMVGQNVFNKASAVRGYVSAVGSFTANVTATTLSPTGVAGTWTNIANTWDGNTGTYGSEAVVGPAWSSFVTFSIPAATPVQTSRYWWDGDLSSSFTLVDIDLFYGGVWNDAYQGTPGAAGGWVTKGTPGVGVSQVRLRFWNDVVVLRNIYLYEYTYVTPNASVSWATSGSHIYKIAVDGANLSLYVDDMGVAKDTDTLTWAVPGNANNIVWGSNATPYFEYIMVTIGGTQRLWYQPNTIISGTILPDRSAAGGNTGAITWGTNPANISVTIGSMVPTDTSVTTTTTRPPRDLLPPGMTTDMFGDSTVAGVATHPLRPIITAVSDNSTLSELQVWRWLGMVLVLAVASTTLRTLRGHWGIAAISVTVVLIFLVATDHNVYPWWLLLFAVGFFVSGLILERSPNL